ncbi:MAG: hypothetical protein ACR2PT_10835 [Endozoicomonas sp.]
MNCGWKLFLMTFLSCCLSTVAFLAYSFDDLPAPPWNQISQCPDITTLDSFVSETATANSSGDEQWVVHLELPETDAFPALCLSFDIIATSSLGNRTVMEVCQQSTGESRPYRLNLLKKNGQGMLEEVFSFSTSGLDQGLAKGIQPYTDSGLWAFGHGCGALMHGLMLAAHAWKSLVKLQGYVSGRTSCGHRMNQKRLQREAVFFLGYFSGYLVHMLEFFSLASDWAMPGWSHLVLHSGMLLFSELARRLDCQCRHRYFNPHCGMLAFNVVYVLQAAVWAIY